MIKKYALENPFMRVEVSNFGARLVRIYLKDLARNVILGYKNLDDYITDPNCLGATIGPNSNRIEAGKFTLDGKTYQWDKNNGPNNIHSGAFGLDKVYWDLEREEENKLVFSIQKDQPFDYQAKVEYLLKENTLEINIKASARETAIFNFTNHAYFNLNGFEDFTNPSKVYNHELKLYSNKITPCDDKLIPTGEIRILNLGIYDFTSPKLLGKTLEGDLSLFGLNKGYDTNYLMDQVEYQKLADISVTDLGLKVYADSPGFQVYTGNFIKIYGKDMPHIGLCIEPQDTPNSINSSVFTKPIYRAGEDFERRITFEFEVR